MSFCLEPTEVKVFEKIIDKLSVHRNVNFKDELKGINEYWQKSTISVGSGTYGSVRLGQSRTVEQKVALKIVKCDDNGVCFSTLREISCLRRCQHVNVISLLDCIFEKRKTYLVLELYDTTLAKFLSKLTSKNTDLSMKERIYKHLFYQLLQGTRYLHSIGIIHGDLKPQNILLNRTGQLAIADFGIAQMLNGSDQLSRYSPIQTRWYRAPEAILHTKSIGTAVDMWSIGCILLEHTSEFHPFRGADEEDQLRVYFNLLGSITKKQYEKFNLLKKKSFNYQSRKRWLYEYIQKNCIFHSDSFYHFISRCLVYLPEYRLTAKKALEHKWWKSEINN